MLSLYRRHLKTCPYFAKGTAHTKCSCPIWCDGELDGKRYRRSLEVRDWQRAIRKVAALEDPTLPRLKPVTDAVEAFENHILSLETSTQRKYKNVLAELSGYCQRAGVRDLCELTVEHLDAYRAARHLSPVTSTKELQTLRQFLSFCFERKWIGSNPAKAIKAPRNIKPVEVVPYTPDESKKIIAACDAIGRTPYERLRARAMVLLLDNTALRISDIATLERDRVRDGRIVVRTLKTGQTVSLPVWPSTQNALDALPLPRGGGNEPRYFFWNGITSKRAVVGIAERTLAAVFKKSKVAGAHAHRFRHTLATRLLGGNATLEEVADILGNSPAIVRKHYSKWSQARQDRIDRLMTQPVSGKPKAAEVGTPVVHKEKSPLVN
ncbi:MAG: tyrosine-type recombinase/integrase [Acidobacteriota bacterium]|nr:tyrosine-type recombinase/integrase [Acidobacteriota bacterium]